MMKKCNLIYEILFLSMIFLISFFFSTCSNATYETPPPAAHYSQQCSILNSKKNNLIYRVRKEDTLYSIAWAFEIDFRLLAQRNSLQFPYQIYPGQELQIPVQQETKKGLLQEVAATNDKDDFSSLNLLKWCWPAEGRVVRGFVPNRGGHKGINIEGYFGEKIRAAAGGAVVYSGNSVRGYGNLLIIKHSDSYFSAYACISKLLVKQGDWVRSGQVIAEMGRSTKGEAMLHFEVRHNGVPINPATCRFFKCLIS